MSRSYRKFLSWPHYEFDPPPWPSFRNIEKKCIRDEVYGVEHGEVLFPQYYGSCDGSWFSSRRFYYPKAKIRNNYFREIRNILNGYIETRYWREDDDHQQAFIKAYSNIKNGISPCEKALRFEWLYTRKAKDAVKNWNGDPIDILYYLTRSGIIEKAVHNECKKMLKK